MINQDLWSDFLPGEVPPDCTYEQFSAAREAIWQQEGFDYNIELVHKYKKIYDTTESTETKELMQKLLTIVLGEVR